MVDKTEVNGLGLGNLFESLAFGEARYGERIFDQKSNILQKAIMNSERSPEDKKRLIGEHIFEELLTHSDFGGASNIQQRYFKKGNPINKSPIKTPPAVKKQVKDFQERYNTWAVQNNQPKIKVDGTYGTETERAIQNWNINNPITESFGIKTGNRVDTKTGKVVPTLAKLNFQLADNVRNVQPINKDPMEIENNDVLSNSFAKIQTNLSTGTAPLIASPKVQSAVAATNPNLTPEERSNLFANASDYASAGIGAMLGTTQIPKYAPTDEYNNMYQDVIKNKNQGFSPEEWATINQGIDGNYAQNIATIKGVSGGGGTAGSVLAAIGSASGQKDSAELNAAVQNNSLIRQNQGIYRGAVMNDLNLDQQLYEADRNNALAAKQAGIQLLDNSLNNISQREQFNDTFGSGTLYDQLNQNMIQGTQTQHAKEQAQLDMLRRFYNGQVNKTTLK